MASLNKSRLCKLAVGLGFALMVIVNWLSVLGKINNLTTVEVSDRYPSLFTPAPYTFSIWGILYMLLLVYVLFQLFSKTFAQDGEAVTLACWFTLSCIANAGWIFAWHYGLIGLSVVVMALLMACLARILPLVSDADETFGGILSRELPFGLYAGWITVATVANIASMLKGVGWNGFGLPEFLWLILTVLIAACIAVLVARKTRNIGYLAAVIWGFGGVLARYTPQFRIDAGLEAMWIVLTLVLCMLALAVQWVMIIIGRVKQ